MGDLGRRTFLKGAGIAALSGARVLPFDKKPDDALLFDLLAEWAPNEVDRHRILVENPQSLYGFAKL